MKTRQLLQFKNIKLLVLSFLILACSPNSFALDGAGTEADPFLIANATDLVEFSNYAANDNSYYKLIADIDMTGETYTSSVNVFKGFIDGDWHIIRNLTITANASPAGFVANMTGGGVQNLGFENLSVENSSIALVGGVTGRINATSPASYYRNIYIKGGTITGGNVGVGGIIGKNNGCQNVILTNCYVDANISGTGVYGGIMGITTTSLSVPESCAFYGNLSNDAAGNYGPILGKGKADSDLDAKNNHAIVGYITKGAGATFTGVVDVAAADITNQSAYSLDFITHWYMGDNYPELQHFYPSVATDTSRITYMNIESNQNLDNTTTYTDILAVSLAEPTMDSTGYAFAGWFSDAALTIPVSVPAIEKGNTDDKTFYAKWTAVTVSNITYMNIGNVAHDNPTTYNNLEEITLSVPTGDSTASSFGGWFTDVDLTIPVSIPAISLGTTGDKTFYAKWQGVLAVTVKECVPLVLDVQLVLDAQLDLDASQRLPDDVSVIGWTDEDGVVLTKDDGNGVQVNDLSPTVSPAGVTTYRMTYDDHSSTNLIVNGDFETDLTAAEAQALSDYTFQSGISNIGSGPNGVFGIGTSPKNMHNTWYYDMPDHTKSDGTGNMFYANGSPSQNRVYYTTVSVMAGRYYALSAWLANIHIKLVNPHRMDFYINDEKIGNLEGESNHDWYQYYGFWKSDVTGDVEVKYVNTNNASEGNDFALDDISLVEAKIIYVTVIYNTPQNLDQ